MDVQGLDSSCVSELVNSMSCVNVSSGHVIIAAGIHMYNIDIYIYIYIFFLRVFHMLQHTHYPPYVSSAPIIIAAGIRM